MALIGTIQKTSNQGGSDKLTAESYGFKKESTVKETWLAYFDVDDDSNYVKKHFPKNLGDIHPTGPGLVLIGRDYDCNGRCDRERGGNQWSFNLEYGPFNPEDIKDPLAMDPRVSFIPERVPEPVFQDVDGKPITNPAGDYYDPPIERSGFTGILRVVLNKDSRAIYPTWLALAENVNDKPWLGFAEKTVRFAPPALPEREWDQENQAYFYPFVLEFEVNPRGWKARPLRSGYRGINEEGKVVVLMDDSGQPLSSPGLLTVEGQHLKPPVAPEYVSFDEYDIYPASDFDQFDFDEAVIFA